MVRDDQVAPFTRGLVQHLLGHVDGQQRPVHLVVGTPHDQPRIVVGLLQGERCEPLDDFAYLIDFHIDQNNDCS